jgi:hypothetical protein
MSVGDEVVNGLVARAVGLEHLGYDRILCELVWLKKRDHHWVFCASVVGEYENAEIGNADKNENCENTFLSSGHAVMIPFQLTPSL